MPDLRRERHVYKVSTDDEIKNHRAAACTTKGRDTDVRIQTNLLYPCRIVPRLDKVGDSWRRRKRHLTRAYACDSSEILDNGPLSHGNLKYVERLAKATP